MGVTIQELGSIGEFFGSLLMAATLIILAFQSVQSSRRLRLVNQLESSNKYMEHIQNIFLSELLLSVFRSGLESYENLNSDHRAIFHGIMLGFYQHWSTGLQQLELGLIRNENFVGLESDFSKILSCSGSQQWWRCVAVSFGNDSRIDELIVQNENQTTITDLLSFLQSGKIT
jgi:hypothetical protein